MDKKEYIERGAAVQLLRECTKMQGKEIEKECDTPILRNVLNVYYLARDGATTLLEDIPPANVVEVVHGAWIHNPKREYDYICSVCRGDAPEDRMGNNAILTPYCPHCGAKMDGGKYETD